MALPASALRLGLAELEVDISAHCLCPIITFFGTSLRAKFCETFFLFLHSLKKYGPNSFLPTFITNKRTRNFLG